MISKAEQESARNLGGMFDALDRFITKLPGATAQHARIFLTVANAKKSPIMKDVETSLSLSKSSASRIIRELSDEPTSKGERRYGVIRLMPSPTSAREKELVLSPKGRDLLAQLLRKIEG